MTKQWIGTTLVAVAVVGWLPCTSAQVPPEPMPILVVGTRHVPPFAIRQEDGTWDGITIELWRRIAAQNEWQFRLEEHALPDLVQGLTDGSLDVVAAALTVTAPREAVMDFSHPFHASGLGITVSQKGRMA